MTTKSSHMPPRQPLPPAAPAPTPAPANVPELGECAFCRYPAVGIDTLVDSLDGALYALCDAHIPSPPRETSRYAGSEGSTPWSESGTPHWTEL